MRGAADCSKPLAIALAIAFLLSSPPAGAVDCAFFEEQAAERADADYSVRMLEACRALASYRDRLLEETVRYAFGPAAAASPETIAERSAPLDTFHVLPEPRRYHLAHETGVFAVLREAEPRRAARPAPVIRLRPAPPREAD